jgi:uncharacterized membrane protein
MSLPVGVQSDENRRTVACLLWSCFEPSLALAQVFPALYGVTGVASNDVLNIRNSADLGAEIIASLPPGAKAVEVLGLSPDGKWALVNGPQVSGYVALRYLMASDWLILDSPLSCRGIEPFWGLNIDPLAKTVQFSRPEGPNMLLSIQTIWPGSAINNVSALVASSVNTQATVVLSGAACSDGMSDTVCGISASLLMRDAKGENPVSYSGCCTIAP